MTIALSTVSKNAAVNAVTALIESGTGTSNGVLILLTSDNSEVATAQLSSPAFGSAVNGTATANNITADTDVAGGLATKFSVRNKDNVEVFSGTISAAGGGGDLQLTTPTLQAGDTFDVLSLSLRLA
jgi:hypothetical protein